MPGKYLIFPRNIHGISILTRNLYQKLDDFYLGDPRYIHPRGLVSSNRLMYLGTAGCSFVPAVIYNFCSWQRVSSFVKHACAHLFAYGYVAKIAFICSGAQQSGINFSYSLDR
jgi:hypothetical protein